MSLPLLLSLLYLLSLSSITCLSSSRSLPLTEEVNDTGFCTFLSGTSRYDFSSLTTDYGMSFNYQGERIIVNPCGIVGLPLDCANGNATVCSQEQGSSDWKILAPLSPPPTWRLDNPANTLGGVGATYKYEDKSVTIHYMCDSKEIYSPRISAMQDDTNKLSIYITHASACPIPVDLNCAPSIDSHQFDFSSLIKIGGVYIKGSTNNQVYYANPCAQAGHASECMDANVCLKLNWSPVWYPIALVTPPPTWSLLDTTNPGLGAIALYNNSVYGMFPTTIKYFYKCDENSERAIWSAENIREHVNEWHVNVTSKECCIVKKKHKRIILKNY